MDKEEWKDRVKGLGLSTGDAAGQMGYKVNTVYRWKEVPPAAEYWLYWKESSHTERVLDRIRGVLGD